MLKTLVKLNIKTIFLVGAVAFLASAYTLPDKVEPLVDSDAVEELKKASKGVAQIAKKASNAVVFVSVSKTVNYQDPFDFFFGQPFGRGRRGPPKSERKSSGVGSGFVVDLDKGYVITNNHVISGADEINLKLPNGESYEAKVIGQDENTDVAVVKIKDEKYDKKNLVELALADSDKSEVGETVMALGAPFGLESSISLGIISAKGRGNLNLTELGNFIQTDAAINPGNSGGPLLNTDGNVIGMNTAIYSKSGGYNGIGFAVPSNIVRSVAEQLINDGKVERGYIGVQLQPLDPNLAESFGLPKGESGSLIADVTDDGPAANAGLKPGDIIVRVEKEKITSNASLVNAIGLRKPGSTINIEYYRDGDKKSAKLKLSQFPGSVVASSSKASTDSNFGLTVSDLSKDLKSQYEYKSRHGVVVTVVARESAAEKAQLKVGDVIVSVNNKLVKNKKEFWNLVKKASKSILRVERDGSFFFVALTK